MSGDDNTILSQSVARIREMTRQRRRFVALVPSGFAGFCAADMLLELFLAEMEGKRVSTVALCNLCPVPMTTALRWIDRLEEKGMILRTKDTTDGRRQFLSVAPKAGKDLAVFVREELGVELEDGVGLAA